MYYIHELLTASTLVVIISIVLTLGFVMHMRVPMIGKSLLSALLAGAILTFLTALFYSKDLSGEYIRIRYGFPHFMAEQEYAHAASYAEDIWDIHVTYFFVNIVFWSAIYWCIQGAKIFFNTDQPGPNFPLRR